MSFIRGFKSGIKAYSKAFYFIRKHKLSWYFIFPLILNIALFVLGYQSIVSLGSEYSSYITGWLNIDTWTFWGSGFLASALMFFLNFILRILFIVVFAYISGYIIIVLMSPVYAHLSEKVENILTGNEYPFHFKQFIKDIYRGIKLATRNFMIEILFTILLFIISFIPVVGLFSNLMLFFISAYFYGFSFIDFSLERKQMKIKDSITFVKTNKGLAIGNGFIFSLTLLLPYFGVLISGFVSVISVVAATISTTETLISINKE